MKNPQLITIPLISLSYDQERWEPSHEWKKKIFNNKNYIKIFAPKEQTDFCYGIDTTGSTMSSYFGENTIAVFSKSDSPAQDNVFLVGLKRKPPFIGKLLKNESEAKEKERKNFMTPTPLHVPASKTSPIADSLHQTLIFKVFSKPTGTRFIKESNINWKHPLIFVQKGNN